MKRKRPIRKIARITSAAIEAFRAGDDVALRDELGLAPWEGPTLIYPGESCPYPGGAGADWHPKGQDLYRRLIELAPDADPEPFM